MSFERRVFADAQSAADACAQHILRTLTETLRTRSYATLALSGGSTPKLMFERMAAAKFQWAGVHLFWVDERPVPPTDERSNYRLAEEALIRPAGIPSNQVHRIRAELHPTAAADMYVEDIRNFFKLQMQELPKFDVIHRGIGPDAHTASLFPTEPLISDRQRIAAAVHVEKLSQWRITLLPGVLLAASHTAMLVSGDDKAEAVRWVFEEPFDPKRYPAQLGIREARDFVWFLDRGAVSRLRDRESQSAKKRT
ncbi:MAG TPA: 6-phosphogluconolactonase [Bryobacteraceae bacterium]|nr:6-phosphogluconolactonase [Bryobacteraceae bacterium]